MFAIILLMGGLGAYYLRQLSNDSQAILQDNYISLEYTSNMQKALTALPEPEAVGEFDRNLKKQEANITEVGEAETISTLRREFGQVCRLQAYPANAVSVG